MNFQRVNEQLTGRNRESRKIANNTYLQRHGDDIAVRLHATDIILYSPNGDITLNSGGWLTVTTKQRMNEYLSGYRISQVRGQWYLYDCTKRADICMYADGMVLHADGTVDGGKPLDAGKAALKLRARALEYGKQFVAALAAGKVPAPGNGDCWYCLMRESSGQGTQYGTLDEHGTLHNQATVNPGTSGRTMGEIGHSAEHILSHIKERYYVPSLLVRAFEVMPVSQVMKWAVAEKWYPEQMHTESGNGTHTFLDKYTSQQIAKTISRYVIRQLGQAA